MSNMCGTVHTLMCKNVPVCDVNYDVNLGVYMGVRSSFNPEWVPMRTLSPNKSIALSELNYWWDVAPGSCTPLPAPFPAAYCFYKAV